MPPAEIRPAGSGPVRAVPGGIELTLRVTPNASATRIEGVETRDDGTVELRIRTNAPPDKGKANKAVIALLAKTLGVPKSAFTLVAGETARTKRIRIEGDEKGLLANCEQALADSKGR
jgi:hypothetical protein